MRQSFDLDFWMNKCEADYKKDTSGVYPEYIDENGLKKTEKSPYFENISKIISKRGYLKRDEFISIGLWKTRRPINSYQKNTDEQIKEITQKVLLEKDIIQKIKLLMSPNLKGVQIAVASAFLTVLYPEQFCIIDYRAWRAMKWLQATSENNQLILKSYREYSDYLDSLKYQGVENYLKYMDSLNTLFPDGNKTLRQIEMALWKFDQMKGDKNCNTTYVNEHRKADLKLKKAQRDFSNTTSVKVEDVLGKIVNSEIRQIAIKLINEIKAFSNVEMSVNSTRISFYLDRVFCCIFPQVSQFTFEVKISRNELDFGGLNVTVHKNPGWSFVHVYENTDLDKLTSVAKQVYLRNMNQK